MADNLLELTFHQCLGKGGFGEVYLATVRRPGGLARRMAVKVLQRGLDGEADAVQRLQDEGRMLAIMDHPCILRAHELVRVAGRVALLTEYVEGVDLSWCDREERRLPARAAAAVIGEVASALDSAWNTISPETGRPLHLVHRDIKPENIRLAVHGQVKLLDFGIARTTEVRRQARTRAGDLPFTSGYAAPETFRRGEQGPATDIYALGVTFYRVVVGEALYKNMEIGEQFSKAAQPEIYGPWLEQRLQKIDADARVRDLIARMVSYDKEDRPVASEVREACELLGDELSGPSLQRWARTMSFPEPPSVPGAELTGQTLQEEPGGVSTSKTGTPPPRPIRRAKSGRGPAPAAAAEAPQPSAQRKATPAPAQRRATPAPAQRRATPAPGGGAPASAGSIPRVVHWLAIAFFLGSALFMIAALIFAFWWTAA